MEDRRLQGDHEGWKVEEEKEEELDLLRAGVVEEKYESTGVQHRLKNCV